MLSEHRRDFIVAKLDMKNAHNEASRAAILKALGKDPSLHHLVWHTATVLTPCTKLESHGKIWGEAGEGLTQGDPEASAWFCIGWQDEVEEQDAVVSMVGGTARFGNDDGYVLGPREIVFPALLEFARRVRERCLLHLQLEKTEVFLLGWSPASRHSTGDEVGWM